MILHLCMVVFGTSFLIMYRYHAARLTIQSLWLAFVDGVSGASRRPVSRREAKADGRAVRYCWAGLGMGMAPGMPSGQCGAGQGKNARNRGAIIQVGSRVWPLGTQVNLTTSCVAAPCFIFCNQYEDGLPIFRGLRIKIGLCTGNAMRSQVCVTTGRTEYFGPIMNHAARLMMAAHGGQVLTHGLTLKALYGLGVNPEDMQIPVIFHDMGRHQLKGVRTRVRIFQVWPQYTVSGLLCLLHVARGVCVAGGAGPASSRTIRL